LASTITIVCKSWIDGSPTVLTVAHGLRSTGCEVECICSACRPATRGTLERAGIKVHEVYTQDPLPARPMAKVMHYLAFRKRAWKLLNQDKESLLWVARIDTAIALGRRLLERAYILALHELHDKYPIFQRAIRLYARNAHRVVTPEICRAAILRCWHSLDRTPFVLPNRPISHPRKRGIVVSDEKAGEVLASMPDGQRILLYQGNLGSDRDLEPVAKAVQQLGQPYRLLIMGKGEGSALHRLRDVCPSLVHIPWVVPPAHLEVTSHAHIGIAFYRFDSLNSVFCAPNKIWEYSGFGIPILCQDLPGLRFTVGVAGAGECVNTRRPEEVVAGISRIEDHYQQYSERAKGFYEATDTQELLLRLLNEA